MLVTHVLIYYKICFIYDLASQNCSALVYYAYDTGTVKL